MILKMLAFITPLRAPQVSRNWRRVCELFERTANSVFAQTGQDFCMVVVCHEQPLLTRAFDSRLQFVPVNWTAPAHNWNSMVADKVNKLMLGLRHARKSGADYAMALDADDLVSRRLSEYVSSQPPADGWYARSGFMHRYGDAWIEPVAKDFNLLCGSCNILHRRWFSFPDDSTREHNVEHTWFGEGHAAFVRLFEAQGATLQPLPFPAVTYVIQEERLSRLDTSNFPPARGRLYSLISNTRLAALTIARQRRLTREIRDEFSIAGKLAA